MNSVLKIKNYLKNNNIEACLISKNNTFLNEFVEDRDNFLLKITKFTGSLGYAIIYKNKQNLYVDGRYTQQAKMQTKNFIIKDISLLKNDIGKIINFNKKLLIDPKTFALSFFGKFNYENLHFFNSNKNLKKKEKLFYLSKNYSGKDSFEKLKKVNKKLTLKKNEVFLITSPENIAWLSNIRSYDKKFSKIFNCIALIKNKRIYIYSDQKINLKIKNIIFKKNSEFKQHLLSIKKIYTDKKYLSLYHHNFFIKNKIKIKFINDPIDQFKSIKNNTEILNLKLSHIFDGVAYCKFLYWLKNNNLKNTSEIECQKKN